jgi:hypothetical protein
MYMFGIIRGTLYTGYSGLTLSYMILHIPLCSMLRRATRCESYLGCGGFVWFSTQTLLYYILNLLYLV